MPRTLRTLALATVLTLAACGGGGTTTTSTSSDAYKGKTITFGAILSLTKAGGVYGPSSQKGADLAVEVLNKSGGINGATIKLDTIDDASDKAQSQQVAQQLIQSGDHLALLGPTLSNSAVAVHPLAESLKTPIVAVSTTGIHIVPDCNFPQTAPCQFVFRDSLGEESAIPANIKAYVDKASPKPTTGVLLVAKDDKFSADGGEVVKKAAPQNGITVTTIEFSKADADLTVPVTQAVQKNPQVIMITSLGDIPARIMIEARRQNFKGQFLGGNGFNTAVVSKQAGEAGRGAQSGSAWYINNDFAGNKEFVSAYRTKYGSEPDQFAAQGYTGLLVLADSAKRAGLQFKDLAADRVKMKDAIEKTSIDKTPLGPFQFTTTHDVRQTIWINQMDGQGGFTLVTSIKPS
jgi:branched-chain amino acid transport system substrate-binding protein